MGERGTSSMLASFAQYCMVFCSCNTSSVRSADQDCSRDVCYRTAPHISMLTEMFCCTQETDPDSKYYYNSDDDNEPGADYGMANEMDI